MYYLKENKIFTTKDVLNPKATLTCGQVFRYFLNKDGSYIVISSDKIARTFLDGENVVIEPFNVYDVEYFINYFDLNKDYGICNEFLTGVVKKEFQGNEKSLNFYLNAIEQGKGIRILNQNLFESFLSFIISQNNNIPRIKGIIEKLCVKYGSKIDGTEYYSFPTATALSKADEADLKNCGLGYRVDFIKQAAIRLNENNELTALSNLPTKELQKQLLGFYGVGNKVANCVLLFGFHRFDSFPVDTWIEKIYREQTDDLKSSRDKIELYYEKLFLEQAALMQQYIFYHIRNLKGISI